MRENFIVTVPPWPFVIVPIVLAAGRRARQVCIRAIKLPACVKKGKDAVYLEQINYSSLNFICHCKPRLRGIRSSRNSVISFVVEIAAPQTAHNDKPE